MKWLFVCRRVWKMTCVTAAVIMNFSFFLWRKNPKNGAPYLWTFVPPFLILWISLKLLYNSHSCSGFTFSILFWVEPNTMTRKVFQITHRQFDNRCTDASLLSPTHSGSLLSPFCSEYRTDDTDGDWSPHAITVLWETQEKKLWPFLRSLMII